MISTFLTDNKLKLNEDKTYLLVMATQQARVRSQSANQVTIKTPNGVIKPTHTQKLLGCWIQDDFKWTTHIRDAKDNLLNSLIKRVSALKIISKVANSKTRKMLANGIFLSKLSYLITV